MSAQITDIEERFWEKVDEGATGDCWEWTAAVDGCGYGNFKLNGKVRSAHRVALALHKDDLSLLDEFDTVRHVCDNPSCVNAASHLSEGTHRDNMIDMSERKRASNQKLDADDAREIKQRYAEEDVSHRDLAAEFGVEKGSISAILAGYSFKHVD